MIQCGCCVISMANILSLFRTAYAGRPDSITRSGVNILASNQFCRPPERDALNPFRQGGCFVEQLADPELTQSIGLPGTWAKRNGVPTARAWQFVRVCVHRFCLLFRAILKTIIFFPFPWILSVVMILINELRRPFSRKLCAGWSLLFIAIKRTPL